MFFHWQKETKLFLFISRVVLFDKKKLREFLVVNSKFLLQRCIIRRTNELLTKYLPVKWEFIVTCKLTALQKQLYLQFVNSSTIKKQLSSSGKKTHSTTMLGKFCLVRAWVYLSIWVF